MQIKHEFFDTIAAWIITIDTIAACMIIKKMSVKQCAFKVIISVIKAVLWDNTFSNCGSEKLNRKHWLTDFVGQTAGYLTSLFRKK